MALSIGTMALKQTKNGFRRRKLLSIATTLALLAIPGAALADITNANVTLQSGQTLDLDNGTTVSSGGDIMFTGTSLVFVGKAAGGTLTALAQSGLADYTAVTAMVLQSLAAFASQTPIAASSLTAGNSAGTIVAVGTNGGNSAKLLVTVLSSSSIGFEYTTFGGTASGGGGSTPSAPTVTGVTNNYSFIPSGFPNSGVSPSSIITVFGSGMAAAPTGTLTLNSSAGAGLPLSQNGTKFSVTVNGTTVTPSIYYVIPSQAALVLPHNTPTGSGTITVTYNNATSNEFAIDVTPTAIGLDTYYGSGNGLITATNATTGALFNYGASAAPGQTITLWGTGLGADPNDSDTVFTSPPHAVNQASTKVYFGGVQGTLLYAGSSGYPGLDQINVTIPSNVTPGCTVSIAVAVGNDVSNFGTAPIAENNGVCQDSVFGITGTEYTTLSEQVNVTSGDVFIGQSTFPENGAPSVNNFAAANFETVTGTVYGTASGVVSIGSCIVSEVFGNGGGNITSKGLDAGSISVKGPAGTYSLTSQSTGNYSSLLPASAITSSGGTFVYTGTGGKDVGAFTATINLPNPLLNWTNQSAAATVKRSNGVLVTWDGGTPGSFVFINGSASSNSATGSFTCYAPQSALQFMVPSYVLDNLPAGSGSMGVENGTAYTRFPATGINYGIGFGFTGVTIDNTYQ